MLNRVMEIRLVCQCCREKFSASTNTVIIICPHCRAVDPNGAITKRSSASREHGKIGAPLISNSTKEKLKRILRRRTQKPAASSGSSSTNHPKSCALDNYDASAKKRAVLCGVSYKTWKYKLRGTLNDVQNMKDLLIHTYKFPEENILVLTEEELDPRLIPTKANIENCLNWLVKDCQYGESLVFYYSGHGLRQPDFDNDERDGFDETICPVDFLKEGMIIDNDIYAMIVKPLPEGVTLHAIVDACHSGTILDLEHVYDRKNPPSGVRKQTSGGKAYSISACEDDQVAADTTAFSSKSMNGALTYILIEVVKGSQNKAITYGELLDEMQERIENANRQGCGGGSRILRRIFGPNLSQKPLLSASEDFPVYEREFKL